MSNYHVTADTLHLEACLDLSPAHHTAALRNTLQQLGQHLHAPAAELRLWGWEWSPTALEHVMAASPAHAAQHRVEHTAQQSEGWEPAENQQQHAASECSTVGASGPSHGLTFQAIPTPTPTEPHTATHGHTPQPAATPTTTNQDPSGPTLGQSGVSVRHIDIHGALTDQLLTAAVQLGRQLDRPLAVKSIELQSDQHAGVAWPWEELWVHDVKVRALVILPCVSECVCVSVCVCQCVCQCVCVCVCVTADTYAWRHTASQKCALHYRYFMCVSAACVRRLEC